MSRHAAAICAAGIVLLCSLGATGIRDTSMFKGKVPIANLSVQKVIDQILENGFDPDTEAVSSHQGSYKSVYQLKANDNVAMLTIKNEGEGAVAGQMEEEISMLLDLEGKGARVPKIYGRYDKGAGPEECGECEHIYVITLKGGKKRWAFFMEYIKSDMTLAQGKVCFPVGAIKKGRIAFENLGADQKKVAKQDLLHLQELFKTIFIMDGQLMCEKSTGHVYLADPAAVYSMEEWLQLAQAPRPTKIRLVSRWKAAQLGKKCSVGYFLRALG